MSTAVSASTPHLDSIVDGHCSMRLTMSVMVDKLIQGQSQAGYAQGVPAEEQELGKATGEKECLIRICVF